MSPNDLFLRLAHRAGLRAMQRLEQNDNLQFLRRHPFCREFSPEALVFLTEHVLERTYSRHEVLFKEGSPGICMYLIRQGRVEIFTQGEGEAPQPHTVYTILGEGALFGELSLSTVPSRTTSARALDAGTVLLALSNADLDRLCAVFPQDGLKLVKGLNATVGAHLLEVDRRLREAHREVAELKKRLAQP
jgi:CRP-like cAMP-binding protein